MNIENARKLSEQLKRLPDKKFDMSRLINHHRDCGTIACIAGWASLLNGGPSTEGGAVWNFASEFLGFDPDGPEAMRLFYGQWSPKGMFGGINSGEAAEELDRLIAQAEQSPRPEAKQ